MAFTDILGQSGAQLGNIDLAYGTYESRMYDPPASTSGTFSDAVSVVMIGGHPVSASDSGVLAGSASAQKVSPIVWHASASDSAQAIDFLGIDGSAQYTVGWCSPQNAFVPQALIYSKSLLTGNEVAYGLAIPVPLAPIIQLPNSLLGVSIGFGSFSSQAPTGNGVPAYPGTFFDVMYSQEYSSGQDMVATVFWTSSLATPCTVLFFLLSVGIPNPGTDTIDQGGGYLSSTGTPAVASTIYSGIPFVLYSTEIVLYGSDFIFEGTTGYSWPVLFNVNPGDATAILLGATAVTGTPPAPNDGEFGYAYVSPTVPYSSSDTPVVVIGIEFRRK